MNGTSLAKPQRIGLFANTPRGARASATVFRLVETAVVELTLMEY
ncbi:transposase IS66 [Alicyclobacillus hesperidum URH17-3-68]|nr:hypothetical protein [Alicyclobacillus hesperidum]EJY54525.1 transposase IS66 [Alicyclobacillus hesperidum URH17-3-68]